MDRNSYLNIMPTRPQGWLLSLKIPWSLSSTFASSFQSKCTVPKQSCISKYTPKVTEKSMHSSRAVVCPGGYLPRGRGVCPGGGVSAQGMGVCPGDGCLPRGRGVCPGSVFPRGVSTWGCLPRGCLPRGICLGVSTRGVSAWGMCLSRGGVSPIACWNTPPPLWTESQTGVKTLPCPKLRLRAVKRK